MSLAVAACVTGDESELGIECDGKCDGLSSVRSLVADAKKLDLADLITIGASFATEQLDGALAASDYAAIRLQSTELYAPASIAANDLTLHSLDTLVSGLATRFGEGALTTEVNQLRGLFLGQSGKRVYAESAFVIRAGLGHAWSTPAAGLDASARLGFDAGVDLEARVITAHDRESSALVASPLAAIAAARGFVLPRSLADIRAMSPGESFALSGRGHLGVNLGVGVPILIANPVSTLTYSLVLTAGLRTMFDGDVDVQLVRMRGDEVVIDVGARAAAVRQSSVALKDGFGVTGLVESSVAIAGTTVDLGKLVDKALNRGVASKLSLIRAAAERTHSAMRISVARVRFHLDAPAEVEARAEALAQALRGDLRLAQALAARGDSGVTIDFDLVRSGASAISYAGVDVLGMSFYRRTAESEGSAVIQTPGGALALMWESLHREGGWFFTSHGFTRIGVAGLRWDAGKTGAAQSETNLFVQTEEGDKFMERDKVIDQLDSIIVAVGGTAALAAIERSGNGMERLVLAKCPLPSSGFDETCNINLIRFDSELRNLRQTGLADFDAAIGQLSADTRDQLHAVAELRLAAQSIEDPVATFVGPTASMVVDYRLDDAALAAVMTKPPQQLADAVVGLMEATQLARTTTDPTAARATIRQRSQPTAAAMADIFAKHADTYARLESIDGARIAGLGEIGGNAVELRFVIDSQKRVDYEHAVGQTVARARAQVAGALFDELRTRAADMPSSGGSRAAHPEQIASFALLALAPPAASELRVNFKTDNSSCSLCGSRERYNVAGFTSLDRYAKGPQATPIAAGLFDIDALIEAP